MLNQLLSIKETDVITEETKNFVHRIETIDRLLEDMNEEQRLLLIDVYIEKSQSILIRRTMNELNLSFKEASLKLKDEVADALEEMSCRYKRYWMFKKESVS